jgi:hypothetical protein
MNKMAPPLVLIQTWLQLALSNTVEFEAAKRIATKNLIKVFGNIDIAKVYFEHNYKKTDKTQRSA